MTKLHPRDVDDRVLVALQRSGRRLHTVEQLAVDTGLSASIVRRSLWRLRADGVTSYRRFLVGDVTRVRRQYHRLSETFTQALSEVA